MQPIVIALSCFLLGLLFAACLGRYAKGLSASFRGVDRQPGGSRLYGIIQSAMEAIITIDEQQNIVLFNPAAEQIFRCPASDAIGTSLGRFIPERFRHAHPHDVERFGRTGISERKMGSGRQVWGLRLDGEEFPMEASISQWQDAQGKLYTVQLRDITERRRAERDLETSRNELTRLSTAIQNIREEEKSHIARELHDDLGQSLTAMKMGLSLLESKLPDEASPARAQAAALHALINATMASVRRIASNLRPVMLDDLGLFAAIEWLAQDFTERYAIAVDVQLEGEHIELNNEITTALFRVVQEAFTNTARHAGAARIELRLSCDAASCRIAIRDDGCGATPEQMVKSESFGLLGIRERVRLLGGSVFVQSEPGQGFHIEIIVPVAVSTPAGAA